MTSLNASVSTLIEEIKQEMLLTPEEQVMVELVLTDSILLTAQMMAGEDVASELRLVRATALNLAEAKRAKVESKLKSFMFDIIKVAVSAAVVG
jgi:hypothetical protein